MISPVSVKPIAARISTIVDNNEYTGPGNIFEIGLLEE